MIFVDIASVFIRAGKGGDGMVSFRREPFVDQGGPDGGDGGRGGDVIFKADRNLNTLADFRQKQRLEAEDGSNGARAKRHGKSGENLIVKVPVGTVIHGLSDDEVIDLSEDGAEAVVAKGGDGGFGNAHFTSSVRQAPKFAEKGEFGGEFELELELKMIADVGLVGLPNAGKSTFLSVISNARPEIADYPFTTLVPNLGVADIDGSSILIADIPGLIEGASEGKGLGGEFLRHIERTATIIHFIDAYQNDIAKSYTTIMNELAAYKVDLTKRAMIVALTKTENMDEDILKMQLEELQKVCKDKKIHLISSFSKQGVNDLLKDAKAQVEKYRTEESGDTKEVSDENVVTLKPDIKKWTVEVQKDGTVRVYGAKIERFARRTDFQNSQAVDRIKDIMLKMGIERELNKLMIEAGTTIYIGKSDYFKIKY